MATFGNTHSPLPPPPSPAGALQIEELRLAGGPSDSEGHVELRLANNSEWGTLCSNNAFAAQVVCRELGYDPAQALARVGGIYGDGGLEPAAKPLCIGNEEALEECKGTVLGSTDNCAAPAFGVSCNGALRGAGGGVVARSCAGQQLPARAACRAFGGAARWVAAHCCRSLRCPCKMQVEHAGPACFACIPPRPAQPDAVDCNSWLTSTPPTSPSALASARRLPGDHGRAAGGRPLRKARPAASAAAGQRQLA